MRAHDVEGRRSAGQRTEEWLLESSEVNDRWRRLPGQRRGFVGELAPGNLRIDAVLGHPFGNASEARNGGRNALAVRKSDEPRVCVSCRRPRSRPAKFEEIVKDRPQVVEVHHGRRADWANKRSRG